MAIPMNNSIITISTFSANPNKPTRRSFSLSSPHLTTQFFGGTLSSSLTSKAQFSNCNLSKRNPIGIVSFVKCSISEATKTATDVSMEQPDQIHTQGPTMMRNGWGKNGSILEIPTNELGQPILELGSKLASYLGVLACNGILTPLNYIKWRKVPKLNKDAIWNHIKVFQHKKVKKNFVTLKNLQNRMQE